jgi:5-methylcytosine-specific restriction endonuclease McrA
MASKWLSKALRTKIELRDNMTCCYCGILCCKYSERVNNTDYATLDHIVSRYELALTACNDSDYASKVKDPATLVVVCNACNSSKKHTPLYVWCMQTDKNYARIIAEISKRITIAV